MGVVHPVKIARVQLVLGLAVGMFAAAGGLDLDVGQPEQALQRALRDLDLLQVGETHGAFLHAPHAGADAQAAIGDDIPAHLKVEAPDGVGKRQLQEIAREADDLEHPDDRKRPRREHDCEFDEYLDEPAPTAAARALPDLLLGGLGGFLILGLEVGIPRGLDGHEGLVRLLDQGGLVIGHRFGRSGGTGESDDRVAERGGGLCHHRAAPQFLEPGGFLGADEHKDPEHDAGKGEQLGHPPAEYPQLVIVFPGTKDPQRGRVAKRRVRLGRNLQPAENEVAVAVIHEGGLNEFCSQKILKIYYRRTQGKQRDLGLSVLCDLL